MFAIFKFDAKSVCCLHGNNWLVYWANFPRRNPINTWNRHRAILRLKELKNEKCMILDWDHICKLSINKNTEYNFWEQ
jgi:hypothetical protein